MSVTKSVDEEHKGNAVLALNMIAKDALHAVRY